jgi:hypothetical protein
MATDMSEKLKVFIGDCNYTEGFGSRCIYARAMWSTDKAYWPNGKLELDGYNFYV